MQYCKWTHNNVHAWTRTWLLLSITYHTVLIYSVHFNKHDHMSRSHVMLHHHSAIQHDMWSWLKIWSSCKQICTNLIHIKIHHELAVHTHTMQIDYEYYNVLMNGEKLSSSLFFNTSMQDHNRIRPTSISNF